MFESLFLAELPPPQRSILFPYTTLFRSEIERFQSPETVGARRFARKQPGAAKAPASSRGNPPRRCAIRARRRRSEEHTSELQSRFDLVCRLLLEKKKSTPHLRLARHRVN